MPTLAPYVFDTIVLLNVNNPLLMIVTGGGAGGRIVGMAPFQVVHFTSTDCSGTPFLEVSTSFFQMTAVAGPGSTVYAGPHCCSAGNAQTITSRSYWPKGGNCTVAVETIGQAYPAAAVLTDLDSLFIPPFHVR
jgi:hypothetical protein